jgi:alpha-L-fucosidase
MTEPMTRIPEHAVEAAARAMREQTAEQYPNANIVPWDVLVATNDPLVKIERQRANAALTAALPHLVPRDTEAVLGAQAREIAALRKALAEVMEWIDNWNPNFVFDDEWGSTANRARAALEMSGGAK